MKFWGIRLLSVVLVVLVCLGIEAFSLRDPLYPRLLSLAGLYVTLAVSLNLINGITGQFSMGHAAFYMVGAYTGGYLSITQAQKWGLTGFGLMVVLMLAGALGAAAAGLIVGLPSLRLKGDYLAVVTLGFGEIIRIIAQNSEKLGGAYGFNVAPKFQSIALIWLLAFLTIAVCRNLLKTAHGLPYLAVREDEIASAAMGVNVTGVKVTAFVLGSAFAGAAGALLASFEGLLTPTMFSMDLSFIILTMVVLGGTGSITGSAIAAIILFYLPEALRDIQPVTGASLLGAVIGVVVSVVAVKKISDNYHGGKAKKAGFFVASCAGGVLVWFILATVLRNVPSLVSATYEGSKLRMVIFAASLIILMLLRPQGVFAHHEFSWTWVGRLLGKKGPNTAVSS